VVRVGELQTGVIPENLSDFYKAFHCDTTTNPKILTADPSDRDRKLHEAVLHPDRVVTWRKDLAEFVVKNLPSLNAPAAGRTSSQRAKVSFALGLLCLRTPDNYYDPETGKLFEVEGMKPIDMCQESRRLSPEGAWWAAMFMNGAHSTPIDASRGGRAQSWRSDVEDTLCRTSVRTRRGPTTADEAEVPAWLPKMPYGELLRKAIALKPSRSIWYTKAGQTGDALLHPSGRVLSPLQLHAEAVACPDADWFDWLTYAHRIYMERPGGYRHPMTDVIHTPCGIAKAHNLKHRLTAGYCTVENTSTGKTMDFRSEYPWLSGCPE
jgi:hypothetical protein